MLFSLSDKDPNMFLKMIDNYFCSFFNNWKWFFVIEKVYGRELPR